MKTNFLSKKSYSSLMFFLTSKGCTFLKKKKNPRHDVIIWIFALIAFRQVLSFVDWVKSTKDWIYGRWEDSIASQSNDIMVRGLFGAHITSPNSIVIFYLLIFTWFSLSLIMGVFVLIFFIKNKFSIKKSFYKIYLSQFLLKS